MEMDDFNPNMEMVPGRGDNYLSVVISSFYGDNLSDAGRMALIKLLLEKGSDKTVALRVAMNMGLTDVIELLISPRDRKIRDIEKKKRLELDKCSSYKKRVETMDAKIEALNKLTDKEFEEKIGKAQMSKCTNAYDFIASEPWAASDFKNTLFLRVTDAQGKQRTFCFVKKFYKGEPFTMNGVDYPDPDKTVEIEDNIFHQLYTNWVYKYDAGSREERANHPRITFQNTTHKAGSDYSIKDTYGAAGGKGGKTGKERYVVFLTSEVVKYYVEYSSLLKKVIKLERQDYEEEVEVFDRFPTGVDEYGEETYNMTPRIVKRTIEIQRPVLRLPKDWSLPLAIYISYYKEKVIGSVLTQGGISETHGTSTQLIYKVDRIVNFNNYDDIEEERECLGKSKKLKM